MGKTIRDSLYIEGLEPLMAELRAMPVELKKGIAEQGRAIADMVAQETAAAASTKAEALAASTIKRSGAQGVRAGNPSSSAGQMFFGTEFGGQGTPRTMQFRPHRGKEGYFFWPKIRSMSRTILDMWTKVLEGVVKDG